MPQDRYGGLHDVAEDRWPPTFGYTVEPDGGAVEALLTNDGQRLTQKTDDLMFVDGSCLGRHKFAPVSMAHAHAGGC